MTPSQREHRMPVGRTGTCRPRRIRTTLICALAAAVTLAGAAQLRADVVTYRLEIVNTWSEDTHPGRFPPKEAHFSWLGGGTHSDRVSFWQEGEVTSPGMTQMAETGVINMLAEEIETEAAAGNAFASLAWRWWFCPASTDFGSCGVATVEFEVDSEFPLVTLATMLGPSPDWFVGVTGLPLREDGRWIPSIEVDLRPYDGGTRSANVWLLFGPTNAPPEPIRLISEESGELVGPASLGTMIFTLISDQAGTAVAEERTNTVPQSFALEQNFPNPANPSTTIRFDLPRSEEVSLVVYNMAGQTVAALLDGVREAGSYSLRWDGRDDSGRELSTGVYLYRLRAGDRVATHKLMLLQ